MKIKFGSIVTDGRGKIGGHVASKNRGGAYLRTKVTPINPQSTAQQTVRNRFTGLTQGWKSLTEDQRTAWNKAVDSFQTTDIFGDLKSPSGAQLYQRLNSNLLNVGESEITSPPSPASVPAFNSLSVVVDTTLATIVATFADAIEEGSKVIISATPGVSAGKSYVKNLYRQIQIASNSDNSPLDITDSYVDKFGSMPEEGQKIYIRFKVISTSTGQAGTPIVAYAIAAPTV